MHTNRGTNVPRTSLPCPPRYGNSTRRRFAKALGANHLLVYYRSGGGSTGLRQVRPPLLSHTILTRETGTKIHMNFFTNSFAKLCWDIVRVPFLRSLEYRHPPYRFKSPRFLTGMIWFKSTHYLSHLSFCKNIIDVHNCCGCHTSILNQTKNTYICHALLET